MIKFSIRTYWNPQELFRAASKAKIAVLKRGGAITRGIMQRSIRFSKKGKSQPGQPFIARSKPGVRNLIKFAVIGPEGRAVIGPERDQSKPAFGAPVPGVLEHGGKTRIKVQPRSKRGEPKAARLARKSKSVTVVVKPRPFAQPALEKFASGYPDLWRDSIR